MSRRSAPSEERMGRFPECHPLAPEWIVSALRAGRHWHKAVLSLKAAAMNGDKRRGACAAVLRWSRYSRSSCCAVPHPTPGKICSIRQQSTATPARPAIDEAGGTERQAWLRARPPRHGAGIASLPCDIAASSVICPSARRSSKSPSRATKENARSSTVRHLCHGDFDARRLRGLAKKSKMSLGPGGCWLWSTTVRGGPRPPNRRCSSLDHPELGLRFDACGDREPSIQVQIGQW